MLGIKSKGKFDPGSSVCTVIRTAMVGCLALLIAPTAMADPFDNQWCRFRTPHFELITDVEKGEAQRIVRRMALFRLSVNQYIGDKRPQAKLPLKVLMFKSRRDFRKTVDTDEFAGFMQPSIRLPRLVLGPQRGNRSLSETALHEYTHYLVRDRIDVSYPLWYEEGLASFLSTMEFADGQVRVGVFPDKSRVADVLRKSDLPLAKVVDTRQVADWNHERVSTFYDWSWLLVHYLYLGADDRRLQIASYLADSDREFNRAFGIDARDMERELKLYLRRAMPVQHHPLTDHEVPGQHEAECLSDAERNLELATTIIRHNAARAVVVLQDLLEQGYTPVETLVALSEAHYQNQEAGLALQAAEDALVQGETSVSARIQLANVLIGDCMFSQAPKCSENWRRAIPLLRSAMRSDPLRYDAIYSLGLAYLHSGQAGDAINYLRVAYTKAPWSPRINFYLGEGYRLIGDRRAKMHLTNARNWASSEPWRRLAELALQNLDAQS